MNYFRELLYRPKRTDKSLMARFYFADLNLNAVAAELDSFDGRKDPERCSCLVNKLRSCQDKLLGICNKMLEEIDPGLNARSREFRAKFPDDILTDNLPGQLWFGAECLAAGSSIMNKERESEAMRPLAKAVTKSLDKVRTLLREQCLTPQPEYTEQIRENIKIFDRLFAEFEFNYVQCMVHVKTVKEYELHQDLIVLFSDTLIRAIKNEMVTQDMVDYYEPSLMFAIPRLAIVYGLLHSPKGPLDVDRSSSNFPDLFLPFKNLLRKIRELLLTLAPHEVLVLEMLLCQHEEPANITTKLKEVQAMLEAQEKSEEGRLQAERLQEKLSDHDNANEECSIEAEEVVKAVIDDVLKNVIKELDARMESAVAIDCTSPDIQVTPLSANPSNPSSVPDMSESSASSTKSTSQSATTPTSCYSPRPRQRLKRHNAKRDNKRIPLRYQKDRRAKFKSTEDLLHRLYVCISGAADQLQSNYAGDFRAILRNVFVINASGGEEEEELDDEAAEENEVASNTVVDSGRQASAVVASNVIVHGLGASFPVDIATDALQHELSENLRNQHLLSSPPDADEHDGLMEEAGAAGNSTYAQNLDLQLQEQDDVLPVNFRSDQDPRGFFQSEPTLLGIASGGYEAMSPPAELMGREAELVLSSPGTPNTTAVDSPPSWVPDSSAPNCMGCGEQFTLFKRRHHCRSCGRVYCNQCSRHSLPLPHFGIHRPVRVCNRCNVIYRSPSYGLSPDPPPTNGPSPDIGEQQPRSSWNRNFGMVS